MWVFDIEFYGESQLGAWAQARSSPSRRAMRRAMRASCDLTYRPRGGRSPQVSLVGKGICFDTGGTNLKPHKSMLDMHTDMEGSAVALGSLYALHALGSPLAGRLLARDHGESHRPLAYKPQDVVRAQNGTTIQVIHTDAEGRMVLADALGLAAREKPHAIIDYRNTHRRLRLRADRALQRRIYQSTGGRATIEAAGAASGERVWVFPMDKDFETDIESSVADVLQCSTDSKGRSHSGGAFFQPLRAEVDSLAASRSRGRHAPRRPRAHRHRDHRLRRALYARTAAPWLAGLTDERSDPSTARRLAPAPARRRGARLGGEVSRPNGSAAPSSCRT